MVFLCGCEGCQAGQIVVFCAWGFDRQEDLLARAAEVGGQLRETAQGLEILKEEVLALRASIRWAKSK